MPYEPNIELEKKELKQFECFDNQREVDIGNFNPILEKQWWEDELEFDEDVYEDEDLQELIND